MMRHVEGGNTATSIRRIIDQKKKDIWKARILYGMCMLLFLYEVSKITVTGMRILFPVYAYGGRTHAEILEETVLEQADRLLSVYVYRKPNLIRERRKDVFRLNFLEQGEMLTLMELENSSLGQERSNQDYVLGEFTAETDSSVESISGDEAESSEAADVQKESVQVTANGFVQHSRVAPIDLSQLADYETLVKKFYTIDAITNIGDDELNARKLGSMDMTMKQTADAPQILIYHTHSQEGYVDSVPGDDSTGIVGAGEYLAQVLRSEYGYNVLHHLGKYDVETRDSAYSRSLPEIKKILEENPTIEVVIDLHRDAVADENTKLVTDLDGRPTAKFMFFNGISRTTRNGKIDYLYNENLEANLAFSFQAKWKAEEYYPGLTRRNYLNAYRYNMHLRPKTTLIELGAQTNTLQEALNACDPIAHILHIVLSGEDA